MTFASLKQFAAASFVTAATLMASSVEAGGCSGGGRPAHPGYPTYRPAPVHTQPVRHHVVTKTCSIAKPAPAPAPAPAVEVVPGQELTLHVSAADVINARLKVAGLSLPMDVVNGDSQATIVTVPYLPLDAPSQATIAVRLASSGTEYIPVTLVPGAAPAAIPTVHSGEEVDFELAGLGRRIGKATLRVSGLSLRAEVLAWNEQGIALQMPSLPITEPVDAELEIILGDGTSYGKQPVVFAPAGAATVAAR